LKSEICHLKSPSGAAMKSEIWNLESPQVCARSARLKTLFCLARQVYRSSELVPSASKSQK